MIRNKILYLVRNKRTSLPTLSIVMTNILSIIKDEKSFVSDLASVISHDQVISARVLRISKTLN